MARNTELFYDIAAVVELHPEKYSQRVWGYGKPAALSMLLPSGEKTFRCGTTHCVAGWAVVLNGGVVHEDLGVSLVAGDLLGLDYDESCKLFSMNWSKGLAPHEVAKRLRAIGDGAPVDEWPLEDA